MGCMGLPGGATRVNYILGAAGGATRVCYTLGAAGCAVFTRGRALDVCNTSGVTW